MKRFYLFLMMLLGSMTMMAQGNDSTLFTVEIDPNITHGAVLAHPVGQVQVGWRVTLTVVPDNGYHLLDLVVYNKLHPTQTVEVANQQVFVMPSFNVVVTATFESDLPAIVPPTIDEAIVAPNAICDGGTLDLTEPAVTNALHKGWQLMPSANAQMGIIDYTGQPLDVSYNKWKLRYWASNNDGIVYSNLVSITVNDLPKATVTGEEFPCHATQASYRVDKDSKCSYTWTVSDPAADVTINNHKIEVLWKTAGTQTVSVEVVNTQTGCSSTDELEVHVQTFVDAVNNLVAKVHDGKEYILIYPNPADNHKYQWYKDGQKINGANGQYYYKEGGLDNGDYQLYVSNNADAQGNLLCGAFTAVHTVNNSRDTYAIHPNPASIGDGLTISNNSTREVSLCVYSIDGKMVHRQLVNPGVVNISLTLPQGIYFCHFNDGTVEAVTQKLIIQ